MSAAPCPTPGELEALLREGAGGTGGAAEGAALRERVTAHAAGCAECRLQLWALAALARPESAEEAAALDRAALRPGEATDLVRAAGLQPGPGSGLFPRPDAPPRGVPRAGSPEDAARRRAEKRARPGPRWRVRLGVLAAALPAAAALLVALRPAPPEAELAGLQAAGRPLEGALSALPAAPYRPVRGPADEAALDRPLRRLLEAEEKGRPGASRALATLYLVRNQPGDAARAERLLARAAGAPDGLNDLGVLQFARGDAAAALDSFAAALEAAPRHRAAPFNRALALGRLGLPERAAAAFERLAAEDPQSAWAPEAKERAAVLRAAAARPPAADPSAERREALRALLAAARPEELAAARERVARLPAGLATDLEKLGRAADGNAQELAARAALFRRYLALRAEVTAGAGDLATLQALAAAAAGDALLEVPALQLLAWKHLVRGEGRAAQALHLRALALCKRAGCAVESEAIALDELAEAAARDGDFGQARRLQDRAEALLGGVAADLQLGELQRKRASFLLEEGRPEAASEAAAQALRALAPATGRAFPAAARAVALNVAGAAAEARGLRRAAAELRAAGLELVRDQPGSDAALDLLQELAQGEAALGRAAQARALLEEERARQEKAGHAEAVVGLRARLAALALRAGDPGAALADAQRGLDEARASGGAWSGAVARLHVAKALAQLALAPGAEPARAAQLAAEARAGLEAAVAAAARAARSSPDPLAALGLSREGREAALELAALGAQQGAPAAALLGPLEELRAAGLGTDPAPGWAQALPRGSCVVALLPRERTLLRVVVAAGAQEVRELPAPREGLRAQVEAVRATRAAGGPETAGALPSPPEEALAAALFSGLPAACAEGEQLWLLAEEPLDRIDLTALPLRGRRLGEQLAAGVISSLGRLVAPEPPWPARAPGATLLVHEAVPAGDALVPALPAAAAERAALQAALGGAPLLELAGPAATPDALLGRLERTGLLHAAVHGSAGAPASGGFLLLSGEASRLSAAEIARARLPAGARVVLPACGAAAAESALGWAFARAGAAAVAAAEGPVDDRAAARWAARFYPALARGLGFAAANREALRAQPPGERRAWFVVLK